MEKQIAIYKCGDLKVMLVVNEHTLDEVLDAFTNVLRGNGYYFEGNLEFVTGSD